MCWGDSSEQSGQSLGSHFNREGWTISKHKYLLSLIVQCTKEKWSKVDDRE